METTSTKQLSQELAEEDHFAELFKQLLLLLVNGRPLSPEEIATATGQSLDEIDIYLSQLPNVELDDQGNLVGMGLTLQPTAHRFEVEGRTLYTWCALDALMFPALLEKTATVESPCQETGQPITAVITPTGIEKVEPSTAVVSIITPETIDDIRGSFCHHVHFFISAEAAAEWLPDHHPHTVVLPVAEAYQLGQSLAQELFNIFTVPDAGCVCA